VVIKDVVPDEEAIKWRKDLQEFVKANPDVEGEEHFWVFDILPGFLKRRFCCFVPIGFPADDKQFFAL
jgi:hypothetical protein